MWLNNCWQVAAFSNELDAPFIARRIADRPLLIYRLQIGEAVAVENLCPHRLVPLSVGRREDDTIVCGYHGMRFGGDGKCVDVPGRASIPSLARIQAYPVTEKWGIIWVWLGEADLADALLLPDFSWLDHSGWNTVSGYIQIDADYRLINDNLLDLSHESFVHPSSIGNGPREVIAEFPVKVTANDRVVTAERIMSDIETPPAFIKMMGLGARINRHQRAIYMAPGFNITESIKADADPKSNHICRQRTMHLLTPETAKSTHYFFMSSRNYRLDDSEIDDVITSVSYGVFAEDKKMLEIQQCALEALGNPAVPRFAWAIDEAPVKARRILDNLITLEQENTRICTRPKPMITD